MFDIYIYIYIYVYTYIHMYVSMHVFSQDTRHTSISIQRTLISFNPLAPTRWIGLPQGVGSGFAAPNRLRGSAGRQIATFCRFKRLRCF